MVVVGSSNNGMVQNKTLFSGSPAGKIGRLAREEDNTDMIISSSLYSTVFKISIF
jgi:hypothetical protein